MKKLSLNPEVKSALFDIDLCLIRRGLHVKKKH